MPYSEAEPSLESAPWGTFAPGAGTLLLRALVSCGLSRGRARKWLARRWKALAPGPIDVERRGIKYRLDIERNTTDEKVLTSSRFYDKKELLFLRGEPNAERSCFVDVGANTGYYSLHLARMGYRRVIAIEPNPPTVALLRQNIDVNDLASVIEVVPTCVGEPGEVPFYCSGGLGSASRLAASPEDAAIAVTSQPLEDILTQRRVRAIDAMKIDIEGFEDRALIPFFTDAPASLWPGRVVIEDCHSAVWQQDVVRFMCERGYTVVGRTRGNALLALDGQGQAAQRP